MAAPFDDGRDWVEVCTYFGGEHEEFELSRTEWVVMDKLLGLTSGRRDEDYVATTLLPALLQALRSASR